MAASQLTPLSDMLGYRLTQLGELARDRAEHALLPLGLRPRLYNVLATVAAHADLSQREIGDALGLDRNVMVALVDELEEAGMACRERSANDRRRSMVRMTPAGRRALSRGHQALAECERELLREITDEERAALHAVAGRLLALDRRSP